VIEGRNERVVMIMILFLDQQQRGNRRVNYDTINNSVTRSIDSFTSLR
jgi:hypothetical protein